MTAATAPTPLHQKARALGQLFCSGPFFRVGLRGPCCHCAGHAAHGPPADAACGDHRTGGTRRSRSSFGHGHVTAAAVRQDTQPIDDGHALRTAGLLAGAQAFYGLCTMIVIALGGLAGQMLAPDPALATLPITTMLVGSTFAAAPASLLMQRFGRRPGFLAGAALGCAGFALAAWAIWQRDFVVFCLATHLVGYYQGTALFYRFAAADSASKHFKPRAISYVLTGGIVAALAGPPLIAATQDALAPIPFMGAFLAGVPLTLVAMVVIVLATARPKEHGVEVRRPVGNATNSDAGHVSQDALKDALKDAPRDAPEDATVNGASGAVGAPPEADLNAPARRLADILRDPRMVIAIMSGMVAYGMMAFVMTASPLAMVICGHSVDAASGVIGLHVIAMYAPSFFCGHLINRFGHRAVITVGLGLMLGCGGVALTGVDITQFAIALVLAGLGWNFAFVGASAWVAELHAPRERGKVQAVNDTIVFGFVAVSSLASGSVMHAVGWDGVILALLLVSTVLLLLVLAFGGRQPAGQRLAHEEQAAAGGRA